jgi:hypothetical protein
MPISLLARLRTKAEQAAGVPVEIVVIQEAGLDKAARGQERGPQELRPDG